MAVSRNAPRLFHVAVPGVVHSRTFRCIWLLEELNIEDFEVVKLTPGQPYGPQMREHGVEHSRKIPTLLMNEREITDSGIISQVLAETYATTTPLMGADEERIELLEWIAMAETCITFRIPLLPALMKEGQDLDALRVQAIEPMREVFKDNVARFEHHFESTKREFLLGSGFSIADTMCGWSLHTMHSWKIMDLAAGRSPKTLAYLERLQSRPGFKSAEQYADVEPGIYRRGCVAV